MIPAGGFLLAMGLAGTFYGWIGAVVAKSPPRSHTAGAGRARALARMAPMTRKTGAASLAVGALLLIRGFVLR